MVAFKLLALAGGVLAGQATCQCHRDSVRCRFNVTLRYAVIVEICVPSLRALQIFTTAAARGAAVPPVTGSGSLTASLRVTGRLTRSLYCSASQ